MPPVHLVLWGNPNFEYPEGEEVRLAWDVAQAQCCVQITKIDDENPEALRVALKLAIEDCETQIVYLSCHGSEEGLSFSRQKPPSISYKTLSTWFGAMNQEIKDDGVGCGSRWLVFGSCESMSPVVNIELRMPSWVVFVAGFVGSPPASEVAQLVAGITINLKNWVERVFAETAIRLEAMPLEHANDWGVTRDTFESAAECVPDDPAMNVLPENKGSVVIARRNPDTGEWSRVSGTGFPYPSPD